MRPSAAKLLWCLVTGALVSAGLAGCADVEEGCLDYRALAVDVYAEAACDDCCAYPQLNLRQVPVRSDTGVVSPVTRTTALVSDSGDTVRLTSLSYFLHDLELELEDGTLVPLPDTFSARLSEADEFALVERSLSRVSPLRTPLAVVGTLLTEGTAVALRMRFGLPADLVAADPQAQRGDSPLFIALDTALLFRDEVTASRRLRSARLVRAGAVDTVTTFVAGGASVPLRFPLATSFPLRRSFNLDVALLLPVDALLELPAGEVSAEDFAAAVYGTASVREVGASR